MDDPIVQSQTKICNACEKTKSLSEFYFAGGRYKNPCKSCKKEQQLSKYVPVSKTQRFSKKGLHSKQRACSRRKSYCPACDSYKNVSEFSKSKQNRDGLATYCRECNKIRDAKYRGKRVEYDRKKNYGLSSEDYQVMHDAQGGVCAICGNPETKMHKGAKVDLCVDHDHDTGRVRGLLCGQCNHGLGNFKDSLDNLSSAMDYLIGLK